MAQSSEIGPSVICFWTYTGSKLTDSGYACFGRSFEAKACELELSKKNCPNIVRNDHAIKTTVSG